MGNLSSLTFMLGANIKDFQTKMKKTSAILEKTGEQMKSMGKNMSMYVTAPLMAMGAASLAAFDKQAQAEAKLAAQVRLNGKDVNATMNAYKQFASQLQGMTTVGDETTLALMQMAESMGAQNVTAATQGAIGLSKALGVDLHSAIKMATLAQSEDYSMLQRYVPALKLAATETEKAAIVSKLFANGLSIAQAEAQTGLGPLKQLQNSLGDLLESFGAIVAEAIQPAVKWLKSVVDAFQNLSDKGKKTIAIIAGIATAIGPLLVVLGTMATVLPTIAAGFALITGPVGLVVGAIGALGAAFVYAYGNYEALKERMGDWSWWRNALVQALQWFIEYNPFSMILKQVNGLIDFFGGDPIPNPFEMLAAGLDVAKTETNEYKTELKSFGQTIKDVMGEAAQSMGFFSQSVSTSTIAATNSVRALLPEITTLKTRLGSLNGNITAKVEILPPAPPEFIDNYSQKLTNFSETANMVGSEVGGAFENLGGRMLDSFDMAEHGFEGFVKGILKTIVKLISMMMAQAMAQAIAGATSSATGTGVGAVATLPIFLSTMVGGVLSAFAAIPKFAHGGFVPPGFPGDTYPALLSSGEMVVPNPIPLGNALVSNSDAKNMNITGQSRISGKDLLIVFDKAQNDRKYTRG